MAQEIARRRFLQYAMAVPSGGLRKIRTAVTPHPTMSTIYLAHELGYFTDVGLDVELTPFNNFVQYLPSFVAGKIDVGFISPSPAYINAIARGARFRIVAARELASPTCGDTGHIYGRRDRFPNGLNDLSVLRGKRVAFGRRASINEFALDTILRWGGLRQADIHPESIDRSETIAALLAGKVDAMVTGAQMDNALASISSLLIRGPGLAQVYPNFQFSHIAFGNGMMDAPLDVGVRFLKAYFRASREFIAGKTPKYLERYAQSNNMDFKQLRDACRTSVAQDGKIDSESLPRIVNWAVEKGYCEGSVRRLELVDRRFLK